jgi:hypothetical protein
MGKAGLAGDTNTSQPLTTKQPTKEVRIMASADSTRHSFRLRLLAVLDYDEIPERQRVKHMANACGCSLSTARKLITIDKDLGNKNSRWLFDLAKGLNVNWLWLHDGNFERFDPRTARIYLSKIRQWTHDKIEGCIYPLLSGVDGEPDYLFYGYDLSPIDVILLEQLRRMTEWERNKQLRLCLRLINKDKKAQRLLDMFACHQITRQQLLSMM